jgi:hypothetical protein
LKDHRWAHFDFHSVGPQRIHSQRDPASFETRKQQSRSVVPAPPPFIEPPSGPPAARAARPPCGRSAPLRHAPSRAGPGWLAAGGPRGYGTAAARHAPPHTGIVASGRSGCQAAPLSPRSAARSRPVPPAAPRPAAVAPGAPFCPPRGVRRRAARAALRSANFRAFGNFWLD